MSSAVWDWGQEAWAWVGAGAGGWGAGGWGLCAGLLFGLCLGLGLGLGWAVCECVFVSTLKLFLFCSFNAHRALAVSCQPESIGFCRSKWLVLQKSTHMFSCDLGFVGWCLGCLWCFLLIELLPRRAVSSWTSFLVWLSHRRALVVFAVLVVPRCWAWGWAWGCGLVAWRWGWGQVAGGWGL